MNGMKGITNELGSQHARLLILGSGPAGLTAAIYAARAQLEPVLVAGYLPGGQLTTTTEVENYPGFPEGVLGPELMDRMRAQAERFGTRFVESEVSSVELSTREFEVRTDEVELTCDALIIATGASARYLGLSGEEALKGFGVSACATCDGFFFNGKEIAVVGGGDSAMEEAIFLTRFATRVSVIHRRDELRASRIMQERVMKNPKIEIIWSSVVKEVLGSRNEGVTALRLRSTRTGESSVFPCQGLFLAIGHDPNTSMLGDEIEKDEKGYLVTTPGSTHTSVPGVFAAGDVQDSRYRQAITAAGSGCIAALDAQRWLEEQA